MTSRRSARLDPSCSPRDAPPPRTYRTIVARYIRDHRAPAAAEMRYYASQPSLRKAVELAALAVTCHGKRHAHQRRIPRKVLQKAKARLTPMRLDLYHSFHALHAAIDQRIRSIPGVGPLMVYDIATRIGAYLRRQPEYVYLHAGTRDGARILGLAAGAFIDPAALPSAFKRLSPREIEDCLCIYRDFLDNAAA